MLHDTLTFTRTIAARPAHVYHCMTDPAARQIWNSPDADAVFRVSNPGPAVAGGRETGTVGPADNPYVTAHADWIITTPGVQLVYAETLEADGMALATALACAAFEGVDGKTQMTLLVQITSFTGQDTVDEVRAGWDHAVGAMAAFAEK